MADIAVLIVAARQAPHSNTRVSIEQLPWRIYPPQFGLFFETPPVQLPARHPFVVSVVFLYPKDAGKLPNCMIAPADAMVPMIYSRGFGPGSYAECKAWIDKNCGRS